MELPSGMKVILISDPDTNISAAAMDVHVGYFSDPDDLPGLAHFCEHLLFLGTDKYPDESSYDAHLKSHGGSSNAFTAPEDTTYFFDVASEHLLGPDGALDRFAQFFIAPQFTESATERELNAIESEDAKNKTLDYWRLLLIENIRTNPRHPHSKFGCGNKKSLLEDPAAQGKSARDAMLPFFHKYYSAKQMTLVVLGKEPLPELQQAVQDKFSPVPNRGDGLRPSLAWIGKVKPFPEGRVSEAFNVVPVKDMRSLELSWALSFASLEEKKKFLDARPFKYIGSVLEYEGPGSLLSYLKRKGWGNALRAFCARKHDDFTTFRVSIDMTSEGLANRFEILAALFSYLDLMRKKGMPSFFASELQAMSDLRWRFQDKTKPATMVRRIAGDMQSYSLKTALRQDQTPAGPNRLLHYDEAYVNQLLDALGPETPEGSCLSAPLITVAAMEFEEDAKEQEKWYGVQYQVEHLGSLAGEWIAPAAIDALELRGPNPFIPEDLSVIVPDGKPPKPGEKLDPPTVVESLAADGGAWKVRHKLDNLFAQPKALCMFQLVSPVAYESPRTLAALYLFESCLDEYLNEYTYDAQVAGLSYSLNFNKRGLQLTARGYGDKMPGFIDKVAEAVATHTPSDPAEFERLRDVLQRVWSSYDTYQPYRHAMYNADEAMEDPCFSMKELQEALDSIELEDLRPLATRVLEEAEGLCLLQGNLDKKDVPRYMEGVHRWLNPTPLSEEKQPLTETKIVMFPHSPHGCGSLLLRPEENETNDNSALFMQFQVSDRSLESRILAEALMATMEDSFYSSLRTKQQLGYIVSSGTQCTEGVSMMYLVIQSAVRGPSYLTERSLEFLGGFRQQLSDMTPGKISDYVQGLVSRKLEPDHRLSSEAYRNWDEIATGQLNFDRRRQEVEALQKIDGDDLLQFFDRHMAEGGDARRVLTSEVYARKYADEMQLRSVAETFTITDAKKWRDEQEKFPIRVRLT
ncbi:unnamed protein product [Scytosiphon promiscuus]